MRSPTDRYSSPPVDYRNFIDGRFVDGATDHIEVLNPADGSLVGRVPASGAEAVDAALQASRELKFGETHINREHFEAMQGFHAGRRKSGIGGADGKHGLYKFTETHVVYIQGR